MKLKRKSRTSLNRIDSPRLSNTIWVGEHGASLNKVFCQEWLFIDEADYMDIAEGDGNLWITVREDGIYKITKPDPNKQYGNMGSGVFRKHYDGAHSFRLQATGRTAELDGYTYVELEKVND